MLVVTSSFAIAQQEPDVLLQMAMQHFGKPNDTHAWWLKDMKGYLDHTHEIRMVLATDNVSFKGAYEIISSKQRFYLDGQYNGEQIVLLETDSLERPTGFIKGDMNDDRFYCEWTDRNSQSPVPLFLYHNRPSQNPCGNVGWAHYFKIQNKVVDSIQSLTVYKNEGETYMVINSKNSHIVHALECENDACTLLRHLPSSLTDLEEIVLDLEKNTLVFKSNEGENSIDILHTKSMYLNCKTYFDFDEKFSFIYPLTSDKKFNQYISSEVVDKYMGVSNHEYQLQNVCSLADRNSHAEFGQIKIDWFSDTLISGLFIFQSSKVYEVTEVPFMYNFIKKRPITINALFDEKFSFTQAKNKIIADVKRLRNSNDDDYFANANYDIVTLSPMGFKCRTAFNTLYGEDVIYIPYEVLRPYFKKFNFNK
jgi:hypothetical protein